MERWENLLVDLATDKNGELALTAELALDLSAHHAPQEDVDDALDTMVRVLRSKDRLDEAEVLADAIRDWIFDRIAHLARIFRRRMELGLPVPISRLDEMARDAVTIDCDCQRAAALLMIGEVHAQAGHLDAARDVLNRAAQIARDGVSTPLLQDREDCLAVLREVTERLKSVADQGVSQ